MSYLWNALSMKCPIYEISYPWNVISMKCAIFEMSYLWNVLSMKYLSMTFLPMKCHNAIFHPFMPSPGPSPYPLPGFTDKRSNDTGSNDKGSNEKGWKVRQRVKRQKVKMIKIFFDSNHRKLATLQQFCTWILYVRHGYNWPSGRSARPPRLS